MTSCLDKVHVVPLPLAGLACVQPTGMTTRKSVMSTNPGANLTSSDDDVTEFTTRDGVRLVYRAHTVFS